ncbi:unnamed protein product [Discosporangium mesarthrocarpum]
MCCNSCVYCCSLFAWLSTFGVWGVGSTTTVWGEVEMGSGAHQGKQSSTPARNHVVECLLCFRFRFRVVNGAFCMCLDWFGMFNERSETLTLLLYGERRGWWGRRK